MCAEGVSHKGALESFSISSFLRATFLFEMFPKSIVIFILNLIYVALCSSIKFYLH